MQHFDYRIWPIIVLALFCPFTTCTPKSYTLNGIDCCPLDKSSWEIKEKIHNCSSLTYHCVRDNKGYLWEICIPARNISKGGCPYIRFVEEEPGFVQQGYTNCNTSDPNCPQEPFHYPSNKLYLYPACITNPSLKDHCQKSLSREKSVFSSHSNVATIALGTLFCISFVIGLVIFIRKFYKGYQQSYKQKRKHGDMEMVSRHDDDDNMENLLGNDTVIAQETTHGDEIVDIQEEEEEEDDDVFTDKSFVTECVTTETTHGDGIADIHEEETTHGDEIVDIQEEEEEEDDDVFTDKSFVTECGEDTGHHIATLRHGVQETEIFTGKTRCTNQRCFSEGDADHIPAVVTSVERCMSDGVRLSTSVIPEEQDTSSKDHPISDDKSLLSLSILQLIYHLICLYENSIKLEKSQVEKENVFKCIEKADKSFSIVNNNMMRISEKLKSFMNNFDLVRRNSQGKAVPKILGRMQSLAGDCSTYLQNCITALEKMDTKFKEVNKVMETGIQGRALDKSEFRVPELITKCLHYLKRTKRSCESVSQFYEKLHAKLKIHVSGNCDDMIEYVECCDFTLNASCLDFLQHNVNSAREIVEIAELYGKVYQTTVRDILTELISKCDWKILQSLKQKVSMDLGKYKN